MQRASTSELSRLSCTAAPRIAIAPPVPMSLSERFRSRSFWPIAGWQIALRPPLPNLLPRRLSEWSAR